jgi:hypothetical protein
MKTIKKYSAPEIELIRLDMQISLQLQSESNDPMGEPGTDDGWSAYNSMGINPANDPMKNQPA